jgi:hypothetical protein
MARQQRMQGLAQNERLCKLDHHFCHAPNATTTILKSKHALRSVPFDLRQDGLRLGAYRRVRVREIPLGD